MLVVLVGPDDYRRERKKREIVSEFEKRESKLGCAKFDMEEEGSLDALRAFLRNRSIFETTKLALLENIADVPVGELKTHLTSALREVGTTVLVSERRALRELKPLLKKPALVQEFPLLAGERWRLFLKREAERCGVRLTPRALHFFARAYEGDSWRMVTELEKISLLGKSEVGERELEYLELETRPAFWNLVRGLRGFSMGERLGALHALLVSGEPAAKIFHMLAYERKEHLSRFAAHDVRVKSGKMDYEETLLDLAIS